MDRAEDLPPRAKPIPGLAGGRLLQRQRVDQDRNGDLLPRRRGQTDAHAQEPAATRSAIFLASAELTRFSIRFEHPPFLPGRGRTCPGHPGCCCSVTSNARSPGQARRRRGIVLERQSVSHSSWAAAADVTKPQVVSLWECPLPASGERDGYHYIGTTPLRP